MSTLFAQSCCVCEFGDKRLDESRTCVSCIQGKPGFRKKKGVNLDEINKAISEQGEAYEKKDFDVASEGSLSNTGATGGKPKQRRGLRQGKGKAKGRKRN